METLPLVASLAIFVLGALTFLLGLYMAIAARRDWRQMQRDKARRQGQGE